MTAKLSNFCYARVIVVCPSGARVRFRILSHRTKFVAKEDGCAQSKRLLTVKDRTWGSQLDRQRNEWDQWQ